MSMEIERRFIRGIEVRKTDGKTTLIGLAVPYASESAEGLGFTETIAVGAFSKHLRADPDVRALVEHDSAKLLGRTRSKTLNLVDDDKGVHATIDVPDTQVGHDITESVKRGDIDGMSFAFRTIMDKWSTENGSPKRTVVEAELYEVSLTGTPVYSDTTVAVRSLEAWRKENTKVNIEPILLATPVAVPQPTPVATPTPNPERRSTPITTGESRDAPVEWRNVHDNREVRVLRPDQKFADLYRNDEPLSLGRAIRALIIGDWSQAKAEQRALSTTANPTAGILVPNPLAASVIDLARAKSVLARAGARTVDMTATTLTIARVATDPTMEVHAENVAFTGSDVSFDAIELTAYTLGTVVKMSRELAADAPNAVSVIEDTLARKLAERIDYFGLRGTSSQEPLGLLNFSGTNTVAVGGAINWDKVLDAVKECEVDNFAPNAFIISPTRINNLRQLKNNSEANNYSSPPPVAANLSTLVTANMPDTTAALGDFSEFLIGLRQSPVIEVTTDGGGAFEAHQVFVKVTWRGCFNTAHREAFCLLTGIA